MGLPELNDAVTAEILLRVRPEEPAYLFRASVVCKLWHRIICNPDFCRRYRSFHRGAPLLGFFYNIDFQEETFSGFDFPAPFSRFVATTVASPLPHGVAAAAHDEDRRVSRALDCRHGRVLFEKAGIHNALAVWDPITDHWKDLPMHGIQYKSYSAVVLCVGRGGSFLVVCVGRDASRAAVACVYSLEDRCWHAPIFNGTQCRSFGMMRPALIGDGIYCTVGHGFSILMYDWVKRRFASIDMPNGFGQASLYLYRRDPVLMQNEDGSLGLALLKGSRLYLWSRRWNNPEEGDAGWVRQRVIKLMKLLPVDNKHFSKASVIGFAEGVGVFFIRTNAGAFTIDLKSRVMKVSNPCKYTSVVPFISVFTPGRAS